MEFLASALSPFVSKSTTRNGIVVHAKLSVVTVLMASSMGLSNAGQINKVLAEALHHAFSPLFD